MAFKPNIHSFSSFYAPSLHETSFEDFSASSMPVSQEESLFRPFNPSFNQILDFSIPRLPIPISYETTRPASESFFSRSVSPIPAQPSFFTGLFSPTSSPKKTALFIPSQSTENFPIKHPCQSPRPLRDMFSDEEIEDKMDLAFDPKTPSEGEKSLTSTPKDFSSTSITPEPIKKPVKRKLVDFLEDSDEDVSLLKKARKETADKEKETEQKVDHLTLILDQHYKRNQFSESLEKQDSEDLCDI